MMRRIFEVAILSAVVVACSEKWSPTAPVDNHASVGRSKTAQSLGGSSGQQVSVTVSGQSVIASTNFAGEISAVADGLGCTVTPSFQNAVETPGSGGKKTATFNLGGDKCGGSICLVTVTDKKNNSAHVQVTVPGSGSGADCV
jgi:hypothetical protein